MLVSPFCPRDFEVPCQVFLHISVGQGAHSELMHLFLPTSPGHKVKSLLFGQQVFFLENDDQHSCLSDPADHSRLTEHIAKAFCLALCPHLKLLKEDGMTKLGLRVTLDSDQVRDSEAASEAGLGSWSVSVFRHVSFPASTQPFFGPWV